MSVNIKNHPTLGARGFSFHSEAVIVSGEAAIEILAREKNFLSCQDLDRSFSAHNHSFLQKKKTLAPRVKSLLTNPKLQSLSS